MLERTVFMVMGGVSVFVGSERQGECSDVLSIALVDAKQATRKEINK